MHTTERLMASPRVLAGGLAALRIFFGAIWASNGLAKLFECSGLDWGFISFTLIDRPGARLILEDASGGTSIEPLREAYQDLVLANWEFFQWFLTITELAIAVSLLFGVASRLGATIGLLLIGPIWIMLLDRGHYLWEYPLDVVPLLILAVVPAGRAFGLDGTLAARFRGRWPF